MIINIVGDCDKRPVLYTVLKVCQTLGDVLLITNSTRLARLSDTRETYGHYQNIMVAITTEGIDDFLEGFDYGLNSFAYVVVDNIPLAEADVTIYVEGMQQSESETDILEYVENYDTIKLYKGNLIDATTLKRLEEFEALRNCCPIGNKIAAAVANVLAPKFGKDAKTFTEIAMQKNPSDDSSGVNKAVGKKRTGVKLSWPSK